MDLVCLKLIRWQCSISEVRNDFVHPLRISYYLTDGFGNVNTRTWQEFQGNTPVRDELKCGGEVSQGASLLVFFPGDLANLKVYNLCQHSLYLIQIGHHSEILGEVC